MKQGGLIRAAPHVRSKKKKRKTRNPAAPKTYHETHISAAISTTLTRRAAKRPAR